MTNIFWGNHIFTILNLLIHFLKLKYWRLVERGVKIIWVFQDGVERERWDLGEGMWFFYSWWKMKKNQLKSQRLKVMLNVNGNLIFCLFCLFLEKLVLAPIAQWKSASGSKIFRCGLLFTQSGWRRGTLSLVHILQMTTLELVTAILWERGRHLHQIKLYKTL